MDQVIANILPNLGLAGFSMWILYKMFLSYQQQSKEKDESMTKLNTEVREILVKQLADNTKALNDNTRALDNNAEALKLMAQNLTVSK